MYIGLEGVDEQCVHDIYLNTGIDRDLFPESTEIKLEGENNDGWCNYWISKEDQVKMFTENIMTEFMASFRSER